MKSTQTLSLVKSKLSSSNLGTHFQRYLHLEDKTLVQTACSVVRKLSMWHNNGSGNELILSSSPLRTARSSPSRAELDETPDLILYDYYQNSKRQQCIVTIGLSERVRKEERRLPLLVLIKELHWISLSWSLWFDPSNNRLLGFVNVAVVVVFFFFFFLLEALLFFFLSLGKIKWISVLIGYPD